MAIVDLRENPTDNQPDAGSSSRGIPIFQVTVSMKPNRIHVGMEFGQR